MSGLDIVAHRLKTDQFVPSAVTVGSVVNIYPVLIPQNAPPPVIVLSQISGADSALINAQSEYPVDRIQVDSVAESYQDARYIANLVRDALKNTIKITINQFGPAGLRVKDVDIIATGDERTNYSDNQTLFEISQDYKVRWRSI